MQKSKNVTRKQKGRPATGHDPISAVRFSAQLTAAIDKWAAQTGAPSRSEAIRRLVERALAGWQPPRRSSHKEASKALEMARREIDRAADWSATRWEIQNRHNRMRIAVSKAFLMSFVVVASAVNIGSPKA